MSNDAQESRIDERFADQGFSPIIELVPVQPRATDVPPLTASDGHESSGIQDESHAQEQTGCVAGPPAINADQSAVPTNILPERLEEIARDLELKKLLEHRNTICTEEEKSQAWSDVADMVKEDWDSKIDKWNKEVDTHLVFAALFSAILTAFNVQSYQLLQPADPVVVALQQISLQLQSFTITPPFLNSTHLAPSIPQIVALDQSPSVQRSAIWLNILWFSGLIISLASTVMGILVKQWFNNYSNGPRGNSREAARLRQYRLENLSRWHVREISLAIPFLLLVSLAMFLGGLLVLLWTLHRLVAIIASFLVGIVAISAAAVTILPFFKQGCAYVSPQTVVLLSLLKLVLPGFLLVLVQIPLYTTLVIQFVLSRVLRLGVPGIRLRQFPRWRLVRIRRSARKPWRGYELSEVRLRSTSLDLGILQSAYRCTLDVRAVSSAAVCLLDSQPVVVLKYWQQLHDTVTHHFGTDPAASQHYPKSDLLVCQAVLSATYLEAWVLRQLEDVPVNWRRPDNSAASFRRALLGVGEDYLQGVSYHDSGHDVAESDVPVQDARSAWLRVMIPWITAAFREPQRPSARADQSLRDLAAVFKVSMPGRGAVDLLHEEMLQCLRDATKPGAAWAMTSSAPDAVRAFASTSWLRYLRSVDEYLVSATCALSADSLSQEDRRAITTNVSRVLRPGGALQCVLCDIHRGSDRPHWPPNTGRLHLIHLRNILNTLNSIHKAVVPQAQPYTEKRATYIALGYYIEAAYHALRRWTVLGGYATAYNPPDLDLEAEIDLFNTRYIGWSAAVREREYRIYRLRVDRQIHDSAKTIKDLWRQAQGI